MRLSHSPGARLILHSVLFSRNLQISQALCSFSTLSVRQYWQPYSERQRCNSLRKHSRSSPQSACFDVNAVSPQIEASSTYVTASTSPVHRKLHDDDSQRMLKPYTPPNTGVLAHLPSRWVPYAELVRLDKPAGTYYLFFPCLFSTLMAAPMASVPASPIQVASTTALFFVGALVMRGAGCTINDLWDRDLDPQVERTRLRPIARRAVTPKNALVFTGFQLLTGLGVLLQFPTDCLYYGIPSLILVATYPLAKRVTHYPQFVLGLAFSWGAMMGFPALGVDLLADTNAALSAVLLYSGCVTWTLSYDMIYAFMDIRDDRKAGIKSIAQAHEHNTKAVLSGLGAVQVALLIAAGVASGAGPIYFVGGCGSAAATLGIMIWRVRLKEVSNCWWWFKNGCLLTGGGISIGLLGDYLARRRRTLEEADHIVQRAEQI